MVKNILFVLSNVKELDEKHKTGVWYSEFAEPYIQLKKEGYKLTIASPEGGAVTIDEKSIQEKQNSDIENLCNLLENTEKLSDLPYDEYDAVVIPGGHAAMIDLAGNTDVARLIGFFFYEKKLIAAICHGVAALTSARTKDNHPIVENVDLTGFSNEEEKLAGTEKLVPFLLESKLKELGANYSCGKPSAPYTIEDDMLITSQNAESSKDFAKAIIEKLQESK